MFFTVDAGFERLLTVGAHEWPHLTVGRHVPLETAVGGEHAVTYQALVGLDARVGADMCLQHPGGHKGSVTL